MGTRKDILEVFKKSPNIGALLQSVESGSGVVTQGLWGAPKALVASLVAKTLGRNVVFLVTNSRDKSARLDDIDFFGCPTLDFPAWEVLPGEDLAPSLDVVGERYKVLVALLDEPEPSVLVTSLSAVQQMTVAKEIFQCSIDTIRKGLELSLESFVDKLVGIGYERCSIAVDKGEFAVRGGIIDIFPVTSSEPYRVVFLDDKISSIRTYDPMGQRTVQKAKSFLLTPIYEKELMLEHGSGSIFDYIKDPIIIYDDILDIEDKAVSQKGLFKNFLSYKDFFKLCNDYQQVFFTSNNIEELANMRVLSPQSNIYSDNLSGYGIELEIFGDLRSLYYWKHACVRLSDYAEDFSDGDYEALDIVKKALVNDNLDTTFAINSQSELRHIKDKLGEGISSVEGHLSEHFLIKDINQLYFPYSEITKKQHVRRKKMRTVHHSLVPEMHELRPGDLVVHFHSGLGKYLGTEIRVNNNGMETEFFILEFAGNSRQFVPISQAHLVNKYIGAHEERPPLDTLGSARWQRARLRTENSIVGYANELLELYAQRKVKGGYACREDSEETFFFEEDFPYSETADQLRAISDVKNNMCSEESMDRLVCGDVGYGKTEVAMRAAFKAVVDGGKQVALLVPTTVLAMQHYENFIQRMGGYPVRIAVLSRYRTAKQKKETLALAAQGEIDILIGTHRIISGDVKFKDLGLIIIDEEQRFGVRAKEHLKKLRVGVDCLTLSATPIPRTLYMSLIGARDMSLINTPPQDRLPIKTALVEWDDETIKNIILRELMRDGQVYFLHNRVETIYRRAEELGKLMPQARIIVVHGQMPAGDIASSFNLFKSGQVDILVATTIIESGIDIPNANTIIIDKADHFGLADLYQLRGRVGRWNRQAYAYLLISAQGQLSEISQRRLEALLETGGYGGGMRLAMRDLEIRGAGDIIGLEQSGHVHTIGFHLYCKLLKRTVEGLQKGKLIMFQDTKLEFPYDARLPEDYIEESGLRMEFYYRLGDVEELQEVDDIFFEMEDRFGPLPRKALWLKHTTRIRVFAAQRYFVLLKLEKFTLTVRMQKGNEKQEHKFLIGPCLDPVILEDKIVKLLG